MNENDLRQALTDAVPDAPEPTGWADAARRRARASRSLAGGGAAAALLLAGSLVWASLPGQGTLGVPAGPSDSAFPAEADPCAGITKPSALGVGGFVPADPTDVRICADLESRPRVIPPTDALTTSAPKLAAAINAANPFMGKDTTCSFDGSLSYFLVFTTSGGPVTVRYDSTCGWVGGSDAARDATALSATINQLWAEQRAGATAPSGTSAACLPPTSIPALWSLDDPPVFGVVCNGADGGAGAAVMAAGDVRLISQDIADHASGYRGAVEWTQETITLASAWGDQAPWGKAKDGSWYRTLADAGEYQRWRPGADVARVLSSLMPITPTPAATSSPSPDPSDLCAAGVKTTAGDIPGDALRLRLCPSGEPELQQFAPLDALDGPGVAEVLKVLRELPRATAVQTCTAELGPEFQLVAEYSGREPVVLQLQLYGCRTVGTSTDLRLGASQVLDAFRTQLAAQRQATTAPGAVDRPGPVCGSLLLPTTSVIPVAATDVVNGVLCNYGSRDAIAPTSTKPLTAAQIAAVVADMKARSRPWQPMTCPKAPTSDRYLSLALTNAWGDVLLVTPDACAGFYTYIVGGDQFQWQPRGAAGKLLATLAR